MNFFESCCKGIGHYDPETWSRWNYAKYCAFTVWSVSPQPYWNTGKVSIHFQEGILGFCERTDILWTRQINYGSKATRILSSCWMFVFKSQIGWFFSAHSGSRSEKVLPFVKFNLTDSQKSELKSVIEECEELLNESVNEIVPVKPINERTKFVNEHRPETSHYKRPGPFDRKTPNLPALPWNYWKCWRESSYNSGVRQRIR